MKTPVAIVALLFASVCQAETPNVVVIMADDFGYGHIGAFNPNSKIPTPNLNALAASGMRFTDAHSGSSVCSPTRYGLLTGRYAWRTRLTKGVLASWAKPLIDDGRNDFTLAEMFASCGYQTGMVGKWHLGWNWKKTLNVFDPNKPATGGPTSHGFLSYFGVDHAGATPFCFLTDDHATYEAVNYFTNATVPDVRTPGFIPEQLTPTLHEAAKAFVTSAHEPFFLYYAPTAPHFPIAPSAEFTGASAASLGGEAVRVADVVMEFDTSIGDLLATLPANTLVIFTGDNGSQEQTGATRLAALGHASNGGWRGYKGSIYEGGHRVPFIASWPGRIEPMSDCSETICLTDLFATFADLLEYPLANSDGPDSFSVLPAMLGEEFSSPIRPPVVHQANDGQLAIRSNNWKCIFKLNTTTPGSLYDLASDPTETTNVLSSNGYVAGILASQMTAYKANGRSRP